MSKSITVFGGNGFLGKRICQAAVAQGYMVTSISRSGSPTKPLVAEDASWIKQVKWRAANIFQPQTYKQYLHESDVVVHSLGILLEKINYKKAINSTGLVNSVLGFMSNYKSTSDDLTAAASGELNTYEKTNHESAVTLAQEFIDNTKVVDPRFVYISADAGFWPVIPQGYINSKRAAEYDLFEMAKDLETHGNDAVKSFSNLVVRPGFMFDEQDSELPRLYLKQVLELAQQVPGASTVFRPSVSTQQVARLIVYALGEEDQHNRILSLESMREA